MGQLIRVARIQLVSAFSVLVFPVLILCLVLAVNFLIGLVVETPDGEGFETGGLMALYIVMLIAHLQTMTQMFSFAVGLSITRRAFFGAVSMIIVGQAVLYGLLLLLGRALERATGGWGIEMTFFDLSFLPESAPESFLVYATPLMLLSFVGVWIGIVFKRWGQYGVWTLSISLGVLGTAVALLLTWQGWWPNVGRFVADQPTLAVGAGYPLIIALVLAAAAYATTRRAVP